MVSAVPALLKHQVGLHKAASRSCCRIYLYGIKAPPAAAHPTRVVADQVIRPDPRRLIQDSAIDLVRPILSCNDQPSIKIAE